MLEPETFDRIPEGVAWSIERSFFPSFVERRETFLASIYRDYWIDIGTPEKYMQVHRDIMDGRYSMPPFNGQGGKAWISPGARIADGARLDGPLFVDRGCDIGAGAVSGLTRYWAPTAEWMRSAIISGAILWANTHIGREARVDGRHSRDGCTIGRNAILQRGVLGDHTHIADYSRL